MSELGKSIDSSGARLVADGSIMRHDGTIVTTAPGSAKAVAMSRVVYISNSAVPSRTANSIHVMKMCQALSSHGCEVTLLTPGRYRDIESHVTDVWKFYGVERIFDIVTIPWLYWLKGKTYVYGLRAARRAKHLDPDVVYCRQLSGAYFSSRLGLPVIFESHAPVERDSTLDFALFRRLLANKNLKRLVVITQALRTHYCSSLPIPDEKLVVLPDGADEMSGQIAPIELPNKGLRLQVGYVGHLYRGKGLEVIAELARSCLGMDFHIVGGLREDIACWQSRCASVRNISFHGHVPHSDVESYLRAFDVLLLPVQTRVAAHGGDGQSIADWTSPLKLFEYMSARKPIISSDIPVLREILQHERNALLCTSDSIEAWRLALERLAGDSVLRNSLSDHAYHDFIENYTWSSRAGKALGREHTTPVAGHL